MELDTVVCGDCLKVMAEVPDKSVNLVVTSPPFNLGGDFHTCGNGKRLSYGAYGEFKDDLPEEEYQKWQGAILNELLRLVKNDGFVFYHHKNRLVKGAMISPLQWINKTAWIVKQQIVIDQRGTPNTDKRRFFPVHELLFVLSKDAEVILNNTRNLTDVWNLPRLRRKDARHPASFHIELPIRCIEAATEQKAVVFDPFMGSGTTAVAALRTGRHFFGCDINPDYVRLAKERIEKAKRQLVPFELAL